MSQTISLTLTNARFQLLETIRVPIALIGAIFFPAASMLFFVVPFTAHDPSPSPFATASMVTFAVMNTSLFSHGVGVAEDRAQPWDPFTRTLPAGPAPLVHRHRPHGGDMACLSLLPVHLF